MIMDAEKALRILRGTNPASDSVDFDDYDRGELETMKYGIERLVDMSFGTLKLMIQKELITEDEAIVLLYNANICNQRSTK